MGFYKGLRNPQRAGEPRGSGGGWASRRQEAKNERTFSFKMMVGKEKPVPRVEHKSQGFYRPGLTPREDLPGGIFATSSRAAGVSSRGKSGLKWAFRLGAIFILLGIVVWSKGRTTALLQDLVGLRLSKVSVEGAHYLTEEEIIRAASLPMGENMFKLDLKATADKVSGLSWVDRVFIERRLPSSLVVSVREKKPVALVEHGSLYGLDREGRLLPPATALLSEDLPLVSGVALVGEAVGTTRMAEALKPALDFLAFLGKEDETLVQNVSEVNLLERGSLKVTFIDGIEATFEPPVSQNELKRMALVLSDLNQKGKRAGTMDFRYQDVVLVKTRN